MNKNLFSLFLLILTATISLQAQNAGKTATNTKLRVYYFHPDERCPIDQAVEENTKKVMQANYQQQIKQGIIDFRIINTDDKANEKLASDFDINAQALYLVKIKKGKEDKNDMTKFAFEFAYSNPLKFKKGLKDAIDGSLR